MIGRGDSRRVYPYEYEHWSVDQAIDEMRRLGHNWVKYSHNGGMSSWHEDHLRAITRGCWPKAASPP